MGERELETMKLCSMAYLPPPAFTGATAFHENVRRFKTTYPLVLLSEHDWPELAIKLKLSPETPFAQAKPHKFVINNVLFFTALKIARDQGFSHLLYLESDCRVGCDNWDGKMFDEYFNIGRPLICGGTCACYNSANWNPKAHQRWERLIVDNATKWQQKPYAECVKNVPIASYGWKAAADKSPACVFPNGALAIYSISWMHELFDLTQSAVVLASNPGPFDMLNGVKIWERFEEDAYEVVGHLASCYSGYGDLVTTPEGRKQMLTSGKVCAVHQIKDNWAP